MPYWSGIALGIHGSTKSRESYLWEGKSLLNTTDLFSSLLKAQAMSHAQLTSAKKLISTTHSWHMQYWKCKGSKTVRVIFSTPRNIDCEQKNFHGRMSTLTNDLCLQLNNERVYTPVENRLRGVSIGNVGKYIVVETDFGVVVKYDGDHYLEITLPQSYFSKVRFTV